MAQYLIHVHSGPDLVNKATLALLLARTAVAEGHAVELFLAADGTHLLNCKAAGEVVGVDMTPEQLEVAQEYLSLHACSTSTP